MATEAGAIGRDGYPALADSVRMHRNADGGFLEIAHGTGQPGGDATTSVFRVEGYILDYLKAVDGQRSRDQLAAIFTGEYGRLFGPMFADHGWWWLVEHPEVAHFAAEPAACAHEVRATGDRAAFFPMHATFEIIETCNFSCDHCYYSSAPWKKGRIELAEAIRIMDTLADNGVRVLEITGGECTIHPEFTEILSHASRIFDLVGIISNGYRIGSHQPTCDAVCAIPNLVAQISIDAIGSVHDKFRKHAKAYDHAVEAVRRLVAAGKVVRLASSITEHTVDQIPGLHRLGKELGVAKHSFTPVAPLGRGCNVSDPGPAAKELVEQINAQLTVCSAGDPAVPYRDIPSFAEGYQLDRNCGAGWRTFAIDYDGNVRACNYSRDSKKFGNILDDSYRDIFGQQASFLFHNAPSPGGPDCFGCDYYHSCQGCFVKAFMVSETVYPQCPWRQRWFPDMPLSLERPEPGTSTESEKRAKVPRFTTADSRHVCTSCSDGAHAKDPVFIGQIGTSLASRPSS